MPCGQGSELADSDALETNVNGIQRSNIYYCDPMQSGQKGELEQARTMLRMVLSKETSFKFLTRRDLNLIMSHINSTPRKVRVGERHTTFHWKRLEKRS